MDRNEFQSFGIAHLFVALRKESVDRNLNVYGYAACYAESLSARRAWIEIAIWGGLVSFVQGRSPQGERG